MANPPQECMATDWRLCLKWQYEPSPLGRYAARLGGLRLFAIEAPVYSTPLWVIHLPDFHYQQGHAATLEAAKEAAEREALRLLQAGPSSLWEADDSTTGGY